jgi:hypothetical protein
MANSNIPERTNINWALRAHAALCAAYSDPFQSALTRQAFGDAHLVFSHHCRANLRCTLCGLTFELSGAQRHGPWAARTMINKPAARPRGHAAARPLERGVRPHRLAPTTSTERDDATGLAQHFARAGRCPLPLLASSKGAGVALQLE